MRTKGVSQSQLAEKINIAQPNLNRLLKGNDIKVSVLIDIAKALEVNPAYLINPDLEGLLNHYRSITNELLEVLIGLIDDYTEFSNTIEVICVKNPKIKQELNSLFIEYYKKSSKNSNKTINSYYDKLPERSKRLHDLINRKSLTNEPKEIIKKGATDKILVQLEKNMTQAASLFEIITFEDENFDTTNVEILYEYYINTKERINPT